MSDRLQRISDNAGRIYATLLVKIGGAEGATDGMLISSAVTSAIDIEREVVRQVGVAFAAPSKPLTQEGGA